MYYSDKDYQQQVDADVQLLEAQHFLLPRDGQFFVNQAKQAHVVP